MNCQGRFSLYGILSTSYLKNKYGQPEAARSRIVCNKILNPLQAEEKMLSYLRLTDSTVRRSPAETTKTT